MRKCFLLSKIYFYNPSLYQSNSSRVPVSLFLLTAPFRGRSQPIIFLHSNLLPFVRSPTNFTCSSTAIQKKPSPLSSSWPPAWQLRPQHPSADTSAVPPLFMSGSQTLWTRTWTSNTLSPHSWSCPVHPAHCQGEAQHFNLCYLQLGLLSCSSVPPSLSHINTAALLLHPESPCWSTFFWQWTANAKSFK